ncbi:hypothetical protein LTR35_011093 [Friedmanniomyces endolithicus]|uniref:Uncharacterized protein n=1 Tax=Friedmanniomyces endolithicus TaxID=329885 RepID=A0AAN6FUZ3_9PEZI|nr:hypothetical protein LTR35_011093 [Friedmanniomyces endolithicus]KAK0277301.1 hypothetical protein LTS00_014274 [Friedmanniomyces endolithicus]KAK0323720.1 hypothetical protein LTR82_005467 [Friedmanniomyces endolithicus]KAK1019002.1 hypothetical protein LTR54_000815 [Friedmanniomyces endolithicus]
MAKKKADRGPAKPKKKKSPEDDPFADSRLFRPKALQSYTERVAILCGEDYTAAAWKATHKLTMPRVLCDAYLDPDIDDELEVEAASYGARALAQYYRRFNYDAEESNRYGIPIYDSEPHAVFDLAQLQTDSKRIFIEETAETGVEISASEDLTAFMGGNLWQDTAVRRLGGTLIRGPSLWELQKLLDPASLPEKFLNYPPAIALHRISRIEVNARWVGPREPRFPL